MSIDIKKAEPIFEYNPADSEYEDLEDNMKILVVNGDGYYPIGELPDESSWPQEFDGYNIDNQVAEDFLLANYSIQRVTYFKEIELAEEFGLSDDTDVMHDIFSLEKNEWYSYSDPSGCVFFKCLETK